MKVLIVGLGAIGQRHLRNLRTLLKDGVQISAYRTRGLTRVLTETLQVEASTGLHEKYAVQVYAQLDAALAARPDAVFVCNPTSQHLPVALAAARAGCAIFVEKPLSHDWEGVDELIDLVEEHRLVGMVGYQLRFHPALQAVQTLVRQGRIGRVLAVRAQVGEYLPAWHGYEDYRETYGARADLGGGALLSQIHEFDYLYWLFGLPRRVYTVGGHLSSLEIDVEDVASTLMECEVDGLSFPVHLQQDYLQRPPSRGLEIIGDAGKLTLDLRQLTLCVFDADGRAEEQSFAGLPRNQLFLDELGHFLACLRAGASPVVSIRDGAQSLRMALAAKHSLSSGQVVALAGTPT